MPAASNSKRSRKRTRIVLPVLSAANMTFLVVAYSYITGAAAGSGLAFAVACVPFVLAIPLAPLLVWSIIKRKWWTVGLNLVGCAFACIALLGANIPANRPNASERPVVRVLTFNIHQGSYGMRSLVEVISREKPQVICLQEVNPADRRGDCVDLLAAFLGGKWEVRRFADCATLSRLRVVRWTRYDLPLHTGRGIVETTLQAHGRVFTVLNTHVSFSSSDRPAAVGESSIGRMARMESIIDDQVAFVVSTAMSRREPVVIAGDFNLPPLSAPYRRISSVYPDAFRSAGWGMGLTFKTQRPYQRIDYIFVDQRFGVSRCYVPSGRASDHRPVVADIVLQR